MEALLQREASRPSERVEDQVRPRLVVVEDDPALRLLLQRMLGAVAEVHCVSSGQDALHCLTKLHDVDLVISDLNLGDMSALDLLRSIEAQGQPWKDRFVICTGGGMTGSQSEALASCGIPVIRKPFRAQALRDLVRGFVD